MIEMFHRIRVEEWHGILRSVGLVLFTAVFILMFLRVIFTPKKKLDHAASLPLEGEETKKPHDNGK
jgi:cbb3-type cytochrome oxidase subunit 3